MLSQEFSEFLMKTIFKYDFQGLLLNYEWQLHEIILSYDPTVFNWKSNCN